MLLRDEGIVAKVFMEGTGKRIMTGWKGTCLELVLVTHMSTLYRVAKPFVYVI